MAGRKREGSGWFMRRPTLERGYRVMCPGPNTTREGGVGKRGLGRRVTGEGTGGGKGTGPRLHDRFALLTDRRSCLTLLRHVRCLLATGPD